MTHFLLVYERSTGELKECADLGHDATAAFSKRVERENRESGNPDIEVVVLSAPSIAALRRTHARYFKSVGELAADIGTRLPR